MGMDDPLKMTELDVTEHLEMELSFLVELSFLERSTTNSSENFYMIIVSMSVFSLHSHSAVVQKFGSSGRDRKSSKTYKTMHY